MSKETKQEQKILRFGSFGFRGLPNTTVAQVVGKQLLSSGTSFGTKYREAQNADSDADFITKVEGSPQELEETAYWLNFLQKWDDVDKLRPFPMKQRS